MGYSRILPWIILSALLGLWNVASAPSTDLAVTVVAVLLAEVWQSSRMAELSITLAKDRGALHQAHANLEFLRAERDRRTTRAVLAPVADRLGLAPLDASRVVQLPSPWIGAGAIGTKGGGPAETERAPAGP